MTTISTRLTWRSLSKRSEKTDVNPYLFSKYYIRRVSKRFNFVIHNGVKKTTMVFEVNNRSNLQFSRIIRYRN